jgi:hypothetical protein
LNGHTLAVDVSILEAAPNARIALTTAANPDEAARLARALVEERLAAWASSEDGAREPPRPVF